jgi:hypothetical protein
MHPRFPVAVVARLVASRPEAETTRPVRPSWTRSPRRPPQSRTRATFIKEIDRSIRGLYGRNWEGLHPGPSGGRLA